MKHVTRWRPDTCGCVLEFEWDDAVPSEERIHTPVNIIKACPVHLSDSKDGIQKHYEKVIDENRSKNIFLDEALKTMPEIRREKINEKGETIYELKEDVNFDFSFDENRNLIPAFKDKNGVEVKTISVLEKGNLETKVLERVRGMKIVKELK